jgi:hypothetical protein
VTDQSVRKQLYEKVNSSKGGGFVCFFMTYWNGMDICLNLIPLLLRNGYLPESCSEARRRMALYCVRKL